MELMRSCKIILIRFRITSRLFVPNIVVKCDGLYTGLFICMADRKYSWYLKRNVSKTCLVHYYQSLNILWMQVV